MTGKFMIALSGKNLSESEFLNSLLREHPEDYLVWFGSVDDMQRSTLWGYSEIIGGCDPVNLLNCISNYEIAKVVLLDYNPFLTFQMLELLKDFFERNIIVVRRNNRFRSEVYKQFGASFIMPSQSDYVPLLLMN
jgi:hypothetical protein